MTSKIVHELSILYYLYALSTPHFIYCSYIPVFGVITNFLMHLATCNRFQHALQHLLLHNLFISKFSNFYSAVLLIKDRLINLNRVDW